MTTSKKGAFHYRVIVALFAVALGTAFAMGARVWRPSLTHSSEIHLRTERVALAVEGMHCVKCAAGIRAMLKRMPGIIAAEVSYEKKEAVVEYDSEKTTPEKIVEAVNNLGYKATVKNKP